jgi:dGTP triphosphohydrolase
VGDNALFVGKDVGCAMNELYQFNMQRIYRSDQAQNTFEQVERSMKIMFDLLMIRLDKACGDVNKIASEDEAQDPTSCWGVFQSFVRDDVGDGRNDSKHQVVLDFLAGMTDSFFCKACVECFLPKGAV